MKKVLIIKNVEREGPGLVADVLDAAGLDFDVVELDRGQTIPSFTGIVPCWGAMSEPVHPRIQHLSVHQ